MNETSRNITTAAPTPAPAAAATAASAPAPAPAAAAPAATPSPTSAPKRVIVAMSGGVDSSVAAKLLVDAGYQALGITMKLTQDSETSAKYDACCSPEDQEDAHRVARQLGFPHKLLNFEAAFERQVIEPFCRDYLQGRTPNPCVQCNRHLKFGALQKCREELGYHYVATGHYARCTYSAAHSRWLLLRGVDETKDQSYFLYHLSQETLAHMLFPLGACTKQQIRQLAVECGLVVANKPESQDICFVENGKYASFIEQHTGKPLEPGPIVNTAGKRLGTHLGLARYTIGQRKGLGVAYSEPLFVLSKNAETNTIVLGTASEQGVRELWATDINLISCNNLPHYEEVQVKANYRQKPVPAQARVEEEAGVPVLHVVFDSPIKACAPGQAAVLYQGEVVVGGGTIARFK